MGVATAGAVGVLTIMIGLIGIWWILEKYGSDKITTNLSIREALAENQTEVAKELENAINEDAVLTSIMTGLIIFVILIILLALVGTGCGYIPY